MKTVDEVVAGDMPLYPLTIAGAVSGWLCQAYLWRAGRAREWPFEVAGVAP